MAPENEDIGVYTRSIQSGKWFLLNVIGQKAINFLTFFVLARLLDPRDYGIIGLVLLIQGLLDQFTNPSFGQALTREKKSIEHYLDPYWTFEIIRYTVIAIFLFFSADAIGGFFHFQGTELTLLRYSGFLFVVVALGNVRQLYFHKDLKFEKIFLRDVLTQIAFAVSAVCYALFVQPTVWALFVGYLGSYITSTVLTYVLYRSRPIFSFKFASLRDLVGYSKWVYGQNLLDVVLAQFDKLIVGRLLNPTSLGLYSKGKDLASMTTSIMSSMIAKVGFAAIAKVQDQMDKVRQGFLKSIDVLILGGLPVTLLLLLEGGMVVSLLLGDKWLGLVIPLKIFAFGNLFIAFVRVVNPVLAALGRPDVNFKTNAIQTIISVPSMAIGYYLAGVNGLAVAVVLTWIFLLVYVILKARPVLNIAVKAFVPAIASGFFACLGVFIIDIAGRTFIHNVASPLITIAWVGGLAALYYACMFAVSRRFQRGPGETLTSIWRTLY